MTLFKQGCFFIEKNSYILFLNKKYIKIINYQAIYLTLYVEF